MSSALLLARASLLVSLALAASQASEDKLPSFASFIAQHGRVYTPGTREYEFRRTLFEQRVAVVKAQNSDHERLWTAGVNSLTDRSEEELAQLRGWRGYAQAQSSSGRATQISRRRSGLFLGQSVQVVIPDEMSWMNLSTVQADVDQGGCGSCWAIAAATVLNAAAERAGLDRTFSGQDLVNCVPNPHNCGGSGGCKGATVELAMNYVVHDGIRTATEAPYHGVDGMCENRVGQQIPSSSFLDDKTLFESKIAVGVHQAPTGSPGANLGLQFWERLPENEQMPLMAALTQHGPVAVSVAASGWSEYSHGIFNSCSVNAIVDHAVALIGFGQDPDRDVKFWEIKNSWGSAWGEQGNIRLLRTDEPECGVDSQPEMGTGCDGGPKEVKVCGMCGILYDSVAVRMRGPIK